MTLHPENSKVCFKRLLNESSSQKFHISLERVNKACDAIESMKGLMNYSRVAQYTENHYGSPKRQTIMNSKRLRLYIDLRKQDYNEKSPKGRHSKPKNTGPQYPCDDLDLKTKVYIDQLRARNAFLEKAMNYLQQEILRETRRTPIDIDKTVTAGAQEDLSMQIVMDHPTNESVILSSKEKRAIQKLLALADNPNCNLEVRERDGKEYLWLEAPMEPKTVLYANELSLLRQL